MGKKLTNHNIAMQVAKENYYKGNGNIANILKYRVDEFGNESIDDSKLALFDSTPTIANEFISTMSNMIVAQYSYDVFREFKMPFMDSLKPMSRLGDIEQYQTPLLSDVEDYEEGKSPFNAKKPSIAISFIKTEAKKVADVRISESIWSGAFITEGGLSNIVGIILKNLRDSLSLYVYDELRKLLCDETKYTKSFTLTKLEGIGDFTNAQKSYEEILNLVTKMSLPSTDYNTEGVKTITPEGRFILYLNSNYKSSYDVNVLASLFNSSSINLKKYFKDIRVIDFPTDTQVGIILDDESLVWGYRINETSSIYNPATMEINVWIHNWLKWGVVPTRNAVRLVVSE